MNPAYAVPGAFGLAMVPHFMKIPLMAGVMTPAAMNAKQSGRQNLSDFQGKIEQSKLDMCGRLTAAHQNSLEGFPLFAAGVAFAVAAKTPVEEVSNYCALYIGARVSYLVFYALPPIAGGLPRTLSWMTSVVAAISLWTNAASSMA